MIQWKYEKNLSLIQGDKNAMLRGGVLLVQVWSPKVEKEPCFSSRSWEEEGWRESSAEEFWQKKISLSSLQKRNTNSKTTVVPFSWNFGKNPTAKSQGGTVPRGVYHRKHNKKVTLLMQIGVRMPFTMTEQLKEMSLEQRYRSLIGLCRGIWHLREKLGITPRKNRPNSNRRSAWAQEIRLR